MRIRRSFFVSEIFPLSEPASDLRGKRGVDYRESGCYAKSVEIQDENEDLILSDNYFDVNGGEKKGSDS